MLSFTCIYLLFSKNNDKVFIDAETQNAKRNVPLFINFTRTINFQKLRLDGEND